MDRGVIRSGDLLVWSTNKKNWLSRMILKFIRFMTASEFAHVGVAWRIEGRLWVVEATIPVVRLSPVKDDDEFFHVPVNLQWNAGCENYLIDKIGLPYSVMDDVRAYLGEALDDDKKWQCAELANDFYRSQGIDIGICSNTPTEVVNNLIIKSDSYIQKFNAITGN